MNRHISELNIYIKSHTMLLNFTANINRFHYGVRHLSSVKLKNDYFLFQDEYDRFHRNAQLEESSKHTNYLKYLSQAKLCPVECAPDSDAMKALILPDEAAKLKFFECGVQPTVLFVRKFYESLFEATRRYKNIALIGSAGTSKSTFQHYILWNYVHRYTNKGKSGMYYT